MFSRKTILAWFGILSLSGIFLIGQQAWLPLPDTNAPAFDVDELIEEVTNSSAEIFMRLGTGQPNEFSFKMGYDSISHASGDPAYAQETPEQSGKSAGDKLVFPIPSGLSTGTRYYYSVAYKKYDQEEWTWRTERSFHTPRNEGSSFRFCVISDYHYYGTAGWIPQQLNNVIADAPDFVISTGDMASVSGQGFGDPVDCDSAYIPLIEGADAFYKGYAGKIMDVYGHSALNFWVNGNHEGVAGYLSSCPLRQQLLDAQKKYLPVMDDDDPDGFFGDFVWGDVHIIWVDTLAFSAQDPYELNDPTGYALGQVQKDWLTATLAGSTSKWKLIFSHQLFGGGGPDFVCSPGKSYAIGNANFVDTPGTDQIYIQSLMETYGAQGFFYGHDHMYSVSEYNGVKYILAGTGTLPYGSNPACLTEQYSPWEVIIEKGHLRVDVTPDFLEISYIKYSTDDSNGDVLDTQFIYASPQPSCIDADEDGFYAGDPSIAECADPDLLDCHDDPSDDASVCETCTCDQGGCSACAKCINPGVTEASYGDPVCSDGIDNDCDNLTDIEDDGC